MSQSRPVPLSEPSPYVSESSSSYLVVRLSDHTLALPVAQVVEICRAPPLRQARGEAPGLLGFAELRGALAAVFDLGALLGFVSEHDSPGSDERELLEDARLVSVRMAPDATATHAGSAAFLVDEVIGLREIPAERIRSIALPGDRSQRIGEFDQEFARLIDSSGLISQEALQQIAEVAQ
jgi:chemotaxis signal transduction protein